MSKTEDMHKAAELARGITGALAVILITIEPRDVTGITRSRSTICVDNRITDEGAAILKAMLRAATDKMRTFGKGDSSEVIVENPRPTDRG